jgi:hypothetical protein
MLIKDELSSNKKGKVKSQNDSVNPSEPIKPVIEGKFYFKAWPNPQESQGGSKFHD